METTIYIILKSDGQFYAAYGNLEDAENVLESMDRIDATIKEYEICLDHNDIKSHLDAEQRQVIERNERIIAQLNGRIEGLEFAIRCNGITGADVPPHPAQRRYYNSYSR